MIFAREFAESGCVGLREKRPNLITFFLSLFLSLSLSLSKSENGKQSAENAGCLGSVAGYRYSSLPLSLSLSLSLPPSLPLFTDFSFHFSRHRKIVARRWLRIALPDAIANFLSLSLSRLNDYFSSHHSNDLSSR